MAARTRREITLAPIRYGQILAKPDGEIVSLRQSSVVALAAHGLLDADQVAAAFRFHNVWQKLDPQRRTANEYEWRARRLGFRDMADHVDVLEAKKQLRQCRILLGVHGFDLLVRICADGYHIRDLYRTRRERDTATDILRIHLSALAALWSVKSDER